MPVPPTYPGIYLQELPDSVHPVTAAPTSIQGGTTAETIWIGD